MSGFVCVGDGGGGGVGACVCMYISIGEILRQLLCIISN